MFSLPWARFWLRYLSAYLSRGWLQTNGGERCPSAVEINRNSKILYRRVAEKNAEDIEHVMAIIGKRERMDDGVVADNYQHDYHCGTDYRLSRVMGRIGEGPSNCGEELTIEKRPGEEGKVRPDVYHLRKMN